MEPFKTINGVVMPIDRTNIDTDAIIPKQFLKRIERTGFGEFVFYEFRFDEQGQTIEDSVFNQSKYQNASVLISRANFGCGSSREHAPWALEDYGFRVIIAPSYADIFYNNCFNNGLLPIKLPNEVMDQLFSRTYAGEGYSLEVNLENQTIKDQQGLEIAFDIDDFHKHKLLNGLDDIGLTMLKEDLISAYEAKRDLS